MTATLIAAISALVAIATLAGPVSAADHPNPETAVAAQTTTSATLVGPRQAATPATVGPQGPSSYDSTLGCCVAPTSALDDLARACSFSAETEVLMADGTTKPISQIAVGDWVLAEDPETGERGARRVTALWVHPDTLVDLEINGTEITTREDHPFWNATDDEWQRADALDTGDLVLAADGDLLAVDGIDWTSTTSGTAYNLTINDLNTYYVAVGDEAVLVHNNNTCGLALKVDGTTGSLILDGPIPDRAAIRGMNQSDLVELQELLLTSIGNRRADQISGVFSSVDPGTWLASPTRSLCCHWSRTWSDRPVTAFSGWPIDRLVEKHLVEEISSVVRGAIANELLHRVSDGSPLSAMGPLMGERTEECLRTVAFVLSEVGLRSIEAMSWLDVLLDADSDWVRHHAVVAVQHSGSLEHPSTTAAAISKLYDVRAVRLAAVRFAAHGSLGQIQTAIGVAPEPSSGALVWLVETSGRDAGSKVASTDIGVAMIGLAGLHRVGRSVDDLSVHHGTELADAAAWLNRTPLPAESRGALRRIQGQSEG